MKEGKYFKSLVYKWHRPNRWSAHMVTQNDLNEINTYHFISNVTFTSKNELHSSALALFKSKVHIHSLNELHIKIHDCRPPIAFIPGEKGINGGVEQPHAQWIISKPKNKTSAQHIISKR